MNTFYPVEEGKQNPSVLNLETLKNDQELLKTERPKGSSPEKDILLGNPNLSEANIHLVEKAKNIFLRFLIVAKTSFLGDIQVKYLNDAAVFKNPRTKYDSIKNFCIRNSLLFFSKLLKKINYLPVLGPYDNLRLFWDLINLISIIFLLFWVPIEMGFGAYLPDDWYHAFFYIFCADLIVNMNTAIIVNGYIIKDRWSISLYYIKHSFILDTVSCLGFALNHPINANQIENVDVPQKYFFAMQWLFFIRIRNLKIIYQKFLERIYSKFNVRDSYIDLFNLIFSCIFIIQAFACFWHFLAYYDDVNLKSAENKVTWMTKIGIDQAESNIRYLYSIYWAAVTIMTVGYGDISPQNSSEIIFTIFAVCCGCGTVAYIISSIGNIAQQFNQERQIFNQNLHVMNKFMNRKKINPFLQMKVRQYLKFIWQEELTQNAQMETEIISKLSKTLKDELYTEANGFLLYKYPMFFANFSEQMLRALMYHMKDVRYNPGDMIFNENEPDDCEIFFLMKGNVQITFNSINRFESYVRKPLGNIKEGQVFGELAFFSGKIRGVSAQSSDFTSLLYIKREDLLNTLKNFPNDYERYCKIRDQILLNNNYMAINVKCGACEKGDHLIANCPSIHMNKDYLMKKQMFSYQQKRRKFMKRTRHKDINALFEINEIQKKTTAFHENNEKSAQFFSNIHEPQNPMPINESHLEYEIPEEHQSHPKNSFLQENQSFVSQRLSNRSEKNGKDSIADNIQLKLVVPKYRNRVLSRYNELEAKNDNKNKKEEFETFFHFSYYYPEYNKIKPLSQNNNVSKNNISTSLTKWKLQRFFLEKEIYPYQKIKRRRVESLFKPKKKSSSGNNNTCLNEKMMTETELQPMNFFDLAFEVLSNENLRKKLTIMKKDAIKTKKNNNRLKYI